MRKREKAKMIKFDEKAVATPARAQFI